MVSFTCLTQAGDEFTLRRDYPVVAYCFLLGDRELTYEEQVSMTDIRHLKARVLKTNPSPLELEIYPETLGDEDLTRDFILRVRLEINPRTNIGVLDYEDFRSAFYRVQRLVNHVGKGVVMRLIDGNRSTRILVQPFAGQFRVTRLLDGLPTLELAGEATGHEETAERQVELLPLYPKGAEDLTVPSFPLSFGRIRALPEALDHTQTPWVVREVGDERYALKPRVIVPEGMNFPKEESFLASKAVWINEWTDAQADEFLHGIERDLKDSERPQWMASVDMVKRLGPRGFALLPVWSVFRRRVPLAFSYGVMIDWLRPEEDGRSFLYELGRNQAWRWELISEHALRREIMRLDNLLVQMGLVDKAPRQKMFGYMLDNPAVVQAPGLREKLAKLVWDRTGCIPALQMLQGTPFWTLNARSDHEKSDMLLAQATEIVRMVEPALEERGRIQADSKEFGGLVGRWLPERVRRLMAAHLRKVLELTEGRHELLSTLYAALLWASLDSGLLPEENPEGYERLRAISAKKTYFKMENAFERSPEWTAWCHMLAAALFEEASIRATA